MLGADDRPSPLVVHRPTNAATYAPASKLACSRASEFVSLVQPRPQARSPADPVSGSCEAGVHG